MKNFTSPKSLLTVIKFLLIHSSRFCFLLQSKFLSATIFLLLMMGCLPASYFANSWVVQGQNQEAAGKYDSAILSYSYAIKRDPINVDAFNNLALIYSKLNKPNDAMTTINKAISLQPKSWKLYYTRASLFEKQELYNQAITDYTTFVSKADKNYISKANKINTPKTGKNNSSKQENYIANTNNNITTFYLGYWGRGKCNLFTKKIEEAIADFSSAIKVVPTDINLYSWRGSCYFEQKKYLEASKDYEVFLEKNPKNYKQQFELGMCYNRLGLRDKAVSVYFKLAEYDPSIKIFFTNEHQLDFFNIEFRHKLTLQYLNEANINLDELKSVTSKSLLEISLTTAFDKLQTAWGYALNLDKDDLLILDSIISKMYFIYPKVKSKPAVPEYVRKFTVQASSNVEEKNYADAIEKYQLALGIAPYYPFAHFNLAILYSTIREYKKAIEQMNIYLKLAPDASDARAAQDKIYEWEIKVKN